MLVLPFKTAYFLFFIFMLMSLNLKPLETVVHHCPLGGRSRYDALLDENYQRDVPPPGPPQNLLSKQRDKSNDSIIEKPLQVVVSLVFLNLALSQTADQILHADVFYYNEWTDDRLHVERVMNNQELLPVNKDTNFKNETNETVEKLVKIKSKNLKNERIVLDHCWANRLWVPDIF